jgi:hypothetical protein
MPSSRVAEDVSRAIPPGKGRKAVITMSEPRRSTIRWLTIAALALAAGPAMSHDGDDPPATPGAAMSAPSMAADPPPRAGVRPGDAFGAASPEIEELDVPRKQNAVERQRRDWIESIWNSP